ncbi:MAG: D-glycero-beta-D-manno-heptose 1-phosphate adenylyltransferase [Bacteroidota bacterium]
MIDLIRTKIQTRDEARLTVSGWRVSGSKVVFTNGCFDLMHPGHLNYLAEARNLGQHLVIGLNTDESVQRLKGSHRPIMDEQARALLLASLAFVDLVVLFGEDTPLELIQMLRPDVLVKGADYKEEDVVGAKEVKSWDGTVALLPFVEGYSTSAIEAKIKSS